MIELKDLEGRDEKRELSNNAGRKGRPSSLEDKLMGTFVHSESSADSPETAKPPAEEGHCPVTLSEVSCDANSNEPMR